MIKWEGGECPVPKGTLIKVRHRDGEEFVEPCGATHCCDWEHIAGDHPGDIVAYEVLEE